MLMRSQKSVENLSVSELSFRLSDEFIAKYEDRPVDWGYDIGGGNSIGELTFLKNYSRVKPDGSKERWFETCRRVIEGMFSIQRDHCLLHKTPWNANKSQRAAEDAYERLFTFKWTPPGRGLWMMGTEFVQKHGSASLQNCSFLSTQHLSSRNLRPFTRLMEMSMLGVGVGFDTRGAEKVKIQEPERTSPLQVLVEDSREGWVSSTELVLQSYLSPGHPAVSLDYSQVRPAGEPIKGFGGVAAGPGPLKKLHENLESLLEGRAGEMLSSTDIVDICNMVGKCVVAGNVRRSAEIAFGEPDDEAFLDLKNWEKNPERMGPDGWGNLSNNSVFAEVGQSYDHLVERMALNGEPGLFYLELARSHGRLMDPPNNRDYRVMGANPCAEQSLEDNEACTLVETYPIKHDSLADFLRTVKVAYLYAKSVTLLPTHWPETNEVMTRNRRIGTSMSGIVMFAEQYGWPELRRWCDAAYDEVKRRDVQYSEWLGVRESIKTTSVKPSGSVSLLAGVTPGVHWPVANDNYIRRIRFRVNEEILSELVAAGYEAEPDLMDPEHTVVVAFPTNGQHVRSERQVSVWEKVALAVLMQRHWADNQVSATFTFQDEEASQLAAILRTFDGQLKSASFLPIRDGVYRQMPYEAIDAQTFSAMRKGLKPLSWEKVYGSGLEAEGERFCTNDSCEL